MRGQDFNTLGIAHKFMRERLKPGDFAVDATAGRGGDTLFLCETVLPGGRVVAFDIQEAAVRQTRDRIAGHGITGAEVILDSHCEMGRYIPQETAHGMMFNFGWLPGGDHNIFTRPETSVRAVELGLSLLRSGGAMSLCIYYGRENGFAERDALLCLLRGLDPQKYTVLLTEFCNRPNNPPLFAGIIKD